MRLVLLANPAAGAGRRAAAAPVVAARLRAAGHDVTEVSGADAASAGEQLRAAVAAGRGEERGVDGVVAVGGDGTVHLALQAVAGTPVPLGLVPTGTGNDVARGLGLLRRDAGAATDALLAALTRPPRVLDAIAVEGARPGHAWCAGVVSAGFDAAVTARAEGMRGPWGAGRYAAAVVLEVARLRAWRYRLVLDGREERLDAVLVTAGNTSSVGGGMRLLPAAQPDDGLLDVLVASPMRRRELLGIFPRVFTGAHAGDPRVSLRRAARVVLEAAPGPQGAPPVAHGDGEPLGPLPLALTCVPGALCVFS